VNRAEEWRARAKEAAQIEAVELRLPSGAKILARRPDAMQFAAWGRLPMSLAGAVSGEGAARVTNEQVAEMAGFLRDLLIYCCADPCVSLDPSGPDEIHPREIPQEDWTYIVNWALRVKEARALEGIRGGRSDARASGDGEAVQPQTV
jgi:hypothetical protein